METPYISAKTHEMLKVMPPWINTAADGNLFQSMNILGMESERLSYKLRQLLDQRSPFDMDPNVIQSISRITGIPSGYHLYYGEDELGYKIPLTPVSSENEFFKNLPTGISPEGVITIPGVTSRILSGRYADEVDGSNPGFVLVTEQFPLDDTAGEFVLDTSGTVLSQTPKGIATQDYESTGRDEEAVFVDNKAQLNSVPISGTLKLYDVINLTDGSPTEVPAGNYSLSGKEITWTAGEPTSRYVAEYDYAQFNNIRSLTALNSKWNIASGQDMYYLNNSKYTYNPTVEDNLSLADTHLISSGPEQREITPIHYSTEVVGSTVYRYLRISPFDVRSGRSVTVSVRKTLAYETSWAVVADTDFVLDMTTVDANVITSSSQGIQIFDGSDNDITQDFISSYDFTNNTLTIYANNTYAAQTLKINVYYITSSSADLTTADEVDTDNYVSELDKKIYYTRVDVSTLISDAVTLPTIDDFTIHADQEFVARLDTNQSLGFSEGYVEAAHLFLETHNQSILVKGVIGEEEHVILLGLSEDTTNPGFYSSALQRQLVFDGTSYVDRGLWSYRDMVRIDNHLYVLSSAVVDGSDYILKSDPDYSKSRIELINLFNFNVDRSFELDQRDLTSLSYGNDHKLYLFGFIENQDSSYSNVLYTYTIQYQYIFLVADNDSQTAYVRPRIKTLIAEQDGVAAAYTAQDHDLFNALDELGIYLGLTRLPNESNAAYRGRLKALVNADRGSSVQGLLNVISAILGTDTYSLAETRQFTFSYKVYKVDPNGDPLPVTVTLDGIELNAIDATDWNSTTTQGYIIWLDEDQSYGNTIEIKLPSDKQLLVTYFTMIDDELQSITETFTPTIAATADSTQIEIYEVFSDAFKDTYRLEDGSLSPDYMALLDSSTSNYKDTWGSFHWDKFYWNDSTKRNTIESVYDGNMPATPKFTDGTDGRLKIVGLSKDGSLIIQPGYFYVDGIEYYYYANKHTLYFNHIAYGGTLPASLPLTIGHVDENNIKRTDRLFPAPGAPLIVEKVTDIPLNIDYSMTEIDPQAVTVKIMPAAHGHSIARTHNYIYPLNSTPVTSGSAGSPAHTHECFLNDNLPDKVNRNGRTDVQEGHYHTITGGVIQTADGHTHTVTIDPDHGFAQPTPSILRTIVSEQESQSTEITQDDAYAVLDHSGDATLRIVGDLQSSYAVHMEINDDVPEPSSALQLDPNRYHFAGTFVGFGVDGPLKINTSNQPIGLTVTLSRMSVRLNQKLGIHVSALDIYNGRINGAKVAVYTADANTTIYNGDNSTPVQRLELGNTQPDGSLYSDIYIDATNVADGGDLTLTMELTIISVEDWGANTAATKQSVDGQYVYTWTSPVTLTYDGA